MEPSDYLLTVLIITGVYFGTFYAGIRYGRTKERKELTAAIIDQTEQTYYAGRFDAEQDCRQGRLR